MIALKARQILYAHAFLMKAFHQKSVSVAFLYLFGVYIVFLQSPVQGCTADIQSACQTGKSICQADTAMLLIAQQIHAKGYAWCGRSKMIQPANGILQPVRQDSHIILCDGWIILHQRNQGMLIDERYHTIAARP